MPIKVTHKMIREVYFKIIEQLKTNVGYSAKAFVELASTKSISTTGFLSYIYLRSLVRILIPIWDINFCKPYLNN